MNDKAVNSPETCKIGIFNKEEIDYETALSIIGFGKYNVYLTVVCGICLFAINANVYSIGFILPAAECDLNLNTFDKGLLTAIGFVGIMTSLYIWGAIADSKGRKKVILISFIGTFAFCIAAIFTPKFWLFATFLFLNGAFLSGASSSVYAYLGEFHDNNSRSRAIAWAALFMTFALVIIPLIAWITISQTFHIEIFGFVFLPWRLFILMCNVPSLFAALAISFFPESPKYLIVTGNTKKAISILKHMYAINSGKCEDDFPIHSLPNSEKESKVNKSIMAILKTIWYQTINLFQKEYLKYITLTCALQFGAFAISSGLLLWYPDILNKLSESYNKYSNVSVTICEAITIDIAETTKDCENLTIDYSVYQKNIIIGVAYCVGCSLVGLLIQWAGKRLLLIVNFLIPGIGCIILTLTTSNLVIDIVFVLVLVVPGLCVAVINAAVVDLFPTQFKAMAVSLCLLSGRFGSVVASSAIGYLLQMSCNGTFYIYIVLMLVCVVLSMFLPNKTHSSKSI